MDQDTAILIASGLSVGAFLLIVSVHLVGLHGAARLFHRRWPISDPRSLRFHHMVMFVLAVMSLLFALHLLTNFAWGLFMYVAGALPKYSECVFYSLENYTSLGLTRVDVGNQWRALAPMISLSGVFCLAWTTAVLVSLASHLYPRPSDG